MSAEKTSIRETLTFAWNFIHNGIYKFLKYRKTPYFLNKNTVFNWQGHKDLNPEPTVLETAALPIELYPYILKAKA